jgi:phage terminase large subunit-like protein
MSDNHQVIQSGAIFILRGLMDAILGNVLNGLDINTLNREQLERLAVIRSERTRQARDGGIWLYRPQSYKDPISGKELYQEAFHRSLARIRWVFGGNRSGKTEAAVGSEPVWWATGEHPYREVPDPCRGWIVSLDFNTSFQDAEKTFFKYLPKSRLVSYDKVRHTAYIKSKKGNISEVTFKSCDQGQDKFQGPSLDFVAYNEEPTSEIRKECSFRLLDRRGNEWCAETPTMGMSWTFDFIWELSGVDKDIEVFNFDTYWNSHIPREELERIERQWDEETKQMRLHGKFIQLSGLIFKNYRKEYHVIKPFDIPNSYEWTKFRTLDHGLNNPTACLWVAINKENEMYIYDELYEQNKTISENCRAIKTISADDRYAWSTIDGSTKTRSATDKFTYYDEYKKYGYIAKPIWLTEERISNAINEIKQRMSVNEKTGRCKFYIFENCYNTIKEISRYRWKDQRKQDDKNNPEKPQDSMNHAITAIFFNILSNAKYIQPEYDYGTRETENQGWYTGSYTGR